MKKYVCAIVVTYKKFINRVFRSVKKTNEAITGNI